MEVTLSISRKTKNLINSEKLERYLEAIADAAKNRVQSNGVTGKIEKIIEHEPVHQNDDGTGEIVGYRYAYDVILTKNNARREETAKKYLEHAQKFVSRTARKFEFKVEGESSDSEVNELAQVNRGPFTIKPLTPEAMNKYFGQVFERDSHIRLIHRAVETAVNTNFKTRNHVLLWGEAASAKTVLFRQLKEFYEDGSDIERVMFISACTSTKAGIERLLLDKARDGLLPEILFLDEIEKLDMTNLSSLLSVMDGSGVIMRTNAREGRVSAETPMKVWATCNQIDKLKEAMGGALFSRFAISLECKRPSPELMRKILINVLQDWEKNGIKVNYKWAEIAENYATNKLNLNDPRKCIALLDGREQLETGEYFKDYEDANNINTFIKT